MKAIVLCAGKGERLRPLTDTCAKPALPIYQGVPLIVRTLRWLAEVGITEVGINLHHLPETIKEPVLAAGFQPFWSYEPDLLGSAGALHAFKSWVGDEDFLVLNGDTLVRVDLEPLVRLHRERGAHLTLGLLPQEPDDFSEIGMVALDSSGRVRGFWEKPDLARQTEARLFCAHLGGSAGVYLLTPQALKYLPEGPADLATHYFPSLIKATRNVYGVALSGHVLDIGTLEGYRRACDLAYLLKL